MKCDSSERVSSAGRDGPCGQMGWEGCDVLKVYLRVRKAAGVQPFHTVEDFD